ncbi:MAG: SDR family oxidoreductase [Acidobacteria bacterium]|nr:SDR family oxidoreductase [Acidobacteriota bacterium]
MRVLVTGASGFLGIELCEHLRQRGHEIIGLWRQHRAPTLLAQDRQTDLRSQSTLAQLMEEVNPSVVIHAAALSDPDWCEKEPELAFAVNAVGTANLVRISPVPVIYISTDLVFDGKDGWYDENAEPRPPNVYAKSKLEGERAVLEGAGVVVRVGLLIGRSRGKKRSFLDWLEERLCHNQPVPLFMDQFRTPVYVPVVCVALEKLLSHPDTKGIFHLGGEQRLNRTEMAHIYFRHFPGKKHLAQPVCMRETTGVVRGSDCSLVSEKLKRLLGISTGTLDQAFGDLARRKANRKGTINGGAAPWSTDPRFDR